MTCYLEFGEEILVSAAVLVYLVLAPVILPMRFVAHFVTLLLSWMFQEHLQPMASWVAHVYHST